MMRIGSAIRRVLALALCVLLGCGAFAGCSQVDDIVSNVTAAGVFPVEVNGVTISSRPSRVVVLSPSLADVILALGCETQLAGASEGCTQSALDELEKVSADSVEAIQALQPDLVLVDPNSSGAQSALEEAGVTVLSVEPATDRSDFERLYSQVSSALLGGEAGYDEGIATAQDIFITLDNINRIVPKDTITTACYLYDLEGQAVTGDMLGSTIMTYSGVTNIFDSLEGGTYDFESLRISDPNLIFCVPGLAEEIKSDSRFQDLQAVRNGQVIELDPTLMEWQGRTVVETAYEISAAAFPELLETNSMEVTDPTETIESEVSSALESAAAESSAVESVLAEDTTEYTTLREGDQGDAVLAMQERLAELGYLTEEYDGYYGSHTAQCVEEFQTTNGLDATGVADADTQRMLFSRIAVAQGEGETSSESSSDSSESSSSSAPEDSASSSSESSSSAPEE